MGEAPHVLELMGQHLQPMELLDKTDEAELFEDVPAVRQILEYQKKFYSILIDSIYETEMQKKFTSCPTKGQGRLTRSSKTNAMETNNIKL